MWGTHVTGAPGAGLLQTPGRRAQRHVAWPLCEQVLLSLPVTRALQLRSFRKYKEAKQKRTRHQPLLCGDTARHSFVCVHPALLFAKMYVF